MRERLCARCGAWLEDDGACARCDRHGSGGSRSGGAGSGVLGGRLLAVGAVVFALVVWAMFIPLDAWNGTNGLIFGVVTVFMLAMAWVVSRGFVEP